MAGSRPHPNAKSTNIGRMDVCKPPLSAMYQDLYIEVKNKQLLKKISVNDYDQLLTDIKKIKINGQWHLNEFTNATKN